MCSIADFALYSPLCPCADYSIFRQNGFHGESFFILNQCLRHKSTYSSNRRKDLLLEIKGDLIYGVHPVYLALRAEKRTFNKIFYNRGSSKAVELAEMAEKRNIPAVQLSRDNLDELTRKVSRYKDHHVHQGSVYVQCSEQNTVYTKPIKLKN
ncbi:uncharacterized protein LOC111715293 [Eurytemora carolleeae]|uniref:uncharacterized protein LOC111715293 n=1 Tax=Eurytemora carolleeae TaxID=1294199 RepID=UPI000C77E8F7|nr:uncharacterized protein LOC111715293 [Eurytemora carolleeae]|eukprot:XP_023346368.1 uncharacterized protein LOC111715293 [Eurytemora affinis]